MPQVRIGNAPLEALRDDITEQGVEAIATAANNHLWMGVGAIKRTGQTICRATSDNGPGRHGVCWVSDPFSSAIMFALMR